MALILKEGKFFKDGKPVPLEFGNWEQIKFIEKRQRIQKALKEGGLEVEPDYNISVDADIYWDCQCGKRMTINVSADDEEDIECFVGKERRCHDCQTHYVVEKNKDGNLVVLKMSNQ